MTFKNLMTSLSLFCLVFSPLATLSQACTTVAVGDGSSRLIGKSYDWNLGHGTVFVNKRNVSKTALVLSPGYKAAQWTSKYGSVTFSQHGREFPLDGMNEAGLVVEIMWLDSAAYGHSPGVQTVNELQWIQYQLDNFATVDEVINALSTLQIVKAYAAVHYFVCDKTSDCAAIEFIKQKAIVHHGTNLPVLTMTNDPYARSVKELKAFTGFGGHLPLPPGTSSLARYVRASALAKKFKNKDANRNTNEVFAILKNVFHANRSQWNIVYDPINAEISFKTLTNTKIKNLNLSQFDFNCGSAVRTFDMNTDVAGPVSGLFIDYTEDANLRLIHAGIGAIESHLPVGTTAMIAHYPLSTQCQSRR